MKTFAILAALTVSACASVSEAPSVDAPYDGRNNGMWEFTGDLTFTNCDDPLPAQVKGRYEVISATEVDGFNTIDCDVGMKVTNTALDGYKACGEGNVAFNADFDGVTWTGTWTVEKSGGGCTYTYEFSGGRK
jgi:hypothetical protein